MEEQELREKIKPTMQAMLLDITKNQPENPVFIFNFIYKALYMINWLQKQGGYTANGKF